MPHCRAAGSDCAVQGVAQYGPALLVFRPRRPVRASAHGTGSSTDQGGRRCPRRNGPTHAAESMRALHARYACNLASRWAEPLVRHHRLGSAHSVGACSACGRGPRPNPQHRRVRIPSGSLCVRVQHLRPELTGGTPTPPAPRCVAGRALSPDRPAMRNERPARIRTAGPTTCAGPIPAAPPHTGHVGRCRVRR